MVGAIGLVFVCLTETPWWPVSKSKMDKARISLQPPNGDIKGYDYDEKLVRLALTTCPLLRLVSMLT